MMQIDRDLRRAQAEGRRIQEERERHEGARRRCSVTRDGRRCIWDEMHVVGHNFSEADADA